MLLGEFGAYDKGPTGIRVKYTTAVARGAEQRGWPGPTGSSTATSS